MLGRGQHFLKRHHAGVTALGKLAIFVIHIRNAAAHASRKIAPGGAQHRHGATRHVFTAVVTGAFDHRGGTRQAHGKTFTRHTTEEGLATGGAKHHGVAHNGVLDGLATEINARAHHDPATAQALAGVIIGVTNQVQGDAACQECTKRLATGALQLNANAVVRQPLGVHRRHGTGQHGTDRAVHVARHFNELHPFALVDGWPALGDQHVVKRLLQAVVLLFDLETRHIGWHIGLCKQAAEIQAAGFPVRQTRTCVEQVRAANQVVKFGNAQLRHDLAHLFSDEEEVVHHMLWLTGELGPQQRVLSRHTDRAGVEVALAHHDAAFDHQRCGGKAEFVRAQQRTNGDVSAGFHLTIGLHPNAATQTVQHQNLLGLGQTNFPRATGVFDGRPGRGTGAAVMPGNHHVVGLALGDACGNGADANFRHQLDADARLWRDIFQVMDQLRQVFNGINVVVRWRRDQANPRHRMAQATDVLRHLGTRQLAALTRLGTLSHLDLDLIGTAQILCRDTEAARGHLFDA